MENEIGVDFVVYKFAFPLFCGGSFSDGFQVSNSEGDN